MDENWRQIPNYPDYAVNQFGMIHSNRSGRELAAAKRYTLYNEPLFGNTIKLTDIMKSVYPDYQVQSAKRSRGKHSQETKDKMSLSKRGKNNPNFKRWYVVNGKKCDTIAEATKHYNKISKTKLSQRSVMRKCLAKADFCYVIDKQKLESSYLK